MGVGSSPVTIGVAVWVCHVTVENGVCVGVKMTGSSSPEVVVGVEMDEEVGVMVGVGRGVDLFWEDEKVGVSDGEEVVVVETS